MSLLARPYTKAQPPIQHMDQAHDIALSDEINIISMLSKDEVLDLRNGPTEIMDTAVEDQVYENFDVIVTEELFEEEEIKYADISAWFRIQDQTQQDINDSVNNERLELDHRRDSYPGAGVLARDIVDSVKWIFLCAPWLSSLWCAVNRTGVPLENLRREFLLHLRICPICTMLSLGTLTQCTERGLSTCWKLTGARRLGWAFLILLRPLLVLHLTKLKTAWSRSH